MEIIYIVVGLLIGSIAAFLVAKFYYSSRNEVPLGDFKDLENRFSRAEEKNKFFEEQITELKSSLKEEQNKFLQLNSEFSKVTNENETLEERLKEQKEELVELHRRMTTEFENLANKILDDKSKKFTDQNKEMVKNILEPLGERIVDFRKRVDEIHEADTKSYSQLITHLNNLKEMNLKMSEEAENLTKALKGDSKVMGSWGEYVLENILEKSGLVKDDHYLVQKSFTDESGKRFQPDIVIKLPDKKSIIIDSKVSLVGYERYASSDTQEEGQLDLKDHIASIRAHIKNLSGKEYQKIEDLDPPDFVLMFIPIEPAFSVAVQKDPNLFNEAFDNNIVIVSPSTLLATLRTIENIWRRENQNKNALEIARQSGALYDKFVGFVEDLIGIGKRIDQSKDSYREAMKKLYDGQGNIVRRIEQLKELGAKASKNIPDKLLDKASND